MRQQNVLDLQMVFGSEGEILIGIALRINDGCRARLFVSDEIGGVSQARQIELFQNHAAPPPNSYFG
jgi:hypothetical protein